MVYPFWKNANFRPFFDRFYPFEIQLLFNKNVTKHFLLLYFALKQSMEKVLILRQKPWTNPFGKMQIFGLFKSIFLPLKL